MSEATFYLAAMLSRPTFPTSVDAPMPQTFDQRNCWSIVTNQTATQEVAGQTRKSARSSWMLSSDPLSSSVTCNTNIVSQDFFNLAELLGGQSLWKHFLDSSNVCLCIEIGAPHHCIRNSKLKWHDQSHVLPGELTQLVPRTLCGSCLHVQHPN